MQLNFLSNCSHITGVQEIVCGDEGLAFPLPYSFIDENCSSSEDAINPRKGKNKQV